MKKLLLSICLCLIGLNGFSQRLNSDKSTFVRFPVFFSVYKENYKTDWGYEGTKVRSFMSFGVALEHHFSNRIGFDVGYKAETKFKQSSYWFHTPELGFYLSLKPGVGKQDRDKLRYLRSERQGNYIYEYYEKTGTETLTYSSDLYLNGGFRGLFYENFFHLGINYGGIFSDNSGGIAGMGLLLNTPMFYDYLDYPQWHSGGLGFNIYVHTVFGPSRFTFELAYYEILLIQFGLNIGFGW